jgi:hypothetical protein
VTDPRIERALSLLQRALRAANAGEHEFSRDAIVEALAVIAEMAVE